MKVTVLGVPDSAGAYCVGVELAPGALREIGLVEKLAAAGCDVHDVGDLTLRRWSPDRQQPRVQNLDVEIQVMLELGEAAAGLLENQGRLLVLGGSCMVAVGLCLAMERADLQPRLVYIDRHLDLNTPESTNEGSLSWMGMAHALRVDGAARQLTDAAGPSALLEPANLVYLGVDEAETTTWERDQRRALDIKLVSQRELVTHPVEAARTAHGLLSAGPFAVHVDVDVLDFVDAPLAENLNGRNSGATVEQLGLALRELVQHRDCWALSIGQLDPAHAASDPDALERFVGAIVSALRADGDL